MGMDVRRFAWVAVVAALVATGAAACSSSDGGDGGDGTSSGVATTIRTEPPGTGRCDPTDLAACLLPWPNDRFTRADSSTVTGRRVDLPKSGMPANVAGVHIDPAEWNRNDGFSPSSIPMTFVRGVDVRESKLPPVTDMARSLDDASPLLLVDLDTGKRLAAWAELDANTPDPAKQLLMIVPAAGLPEGHRIAVGLRNLRRADGRLIRRSKAFDDLVTRPDALARTWLRALVDEGVDPADLTIAWSFTVGSGDDISGRLRAMWDETRKEVGDGAPAFTVTATREAGPARIVTGTFEMPQYLTGDGGPGTVLNNGASRDGIPARNGTMTVDFTCTVPLKADQDGPAPSVIYGHGLLGDRNQVLDIGTIGASVNVAFCGLDYLGMSNQDVPKLVDSFEDLTRFRTLPDRLQQGHLSFLLLGRLLASPEGFVTDKAFQTTAGTPALDTGKVSLLGASQGGILGGVASSLSRDWTRVILAVPGMGYNLLLRRSVDFDEFAPIVEQNYPDELQQSILLDLLEQLWQRGENTGYAQHLTTHPYPGVPAKDVMLLEAFGDHQVANVSTEKLARTLGIGRRAPSLADGRSTDREPFWGIDPVRLPTSGSALIMWDFGTPAPPTENLPNRAGDDPHGKLADEPSALALVAAFIPPDGQVIDVCGAGKPCRSDG